MDTEHLAFASLPLVEKMIPGFFFALLAQVFHEGARNFLPPSLSELALARGAVCLLPPLSPHATCDDGDGDMTMMVVMIYILR